MAGELSIVGDFEPAGVRIDLRRDTGRLEIFAVVRADSEDRFSVEGGVEDGTAALRIRRMPFTWQGPCFP